MPPRHAYWTIIVDDQPTSFRAHDLEELLPTFNRLRQKHPNAEMKWFERGQLWESRDAAREQGFGHGERRWEGPRPERHDDERGEKRQDERPRDRDWRPGGEHRDPRQHYKDAKKAKWDRYKQNIRARWERNQQHPVEDHGEHTPPHGDPIRPKIRGDAEREWRNDQFRGQGREDRPRDQRRDRPREQRQFRPDAERRGEWKPKGRAPGPSSWRPRDDRESAGPPKKSWSPNPSERGKRPWGSKPAGAGGRPWSGKSAGARKRPWGSKPEHSEQSGSRRPGSSRGGHGARGPKKPRGGDE